MLKENGGLQFRMAELRTSGEGEVGGCGRALELVEMQGVSLLYGPSGCR